jgi:histidinol-phosphatase (PHP family)
MGLRKNKMKTNYHTHTYRCHHATGDVEDYVACALDCGINILGISDHTPLPDDKWPEDRMTLLELEAYTEKIETETAKYNGKLKILKGMECDVAPEHMEFFRRELLGKRNYDYLIASTHWIEWQGEKVHAAMLTEEDQVAIYKDNLIYGIQQKLFAFVGHPDFFAVTFHEMTPRVEKYCREIFQAAVEYKIPLEINGSGLTRNVPFYPWNDFWTLGREYDLQVICNSDAHAPEHVGNIIEPRKLADRLGLEVVNHI